MQLNLAQTKLVGLTMKLELKAREYNVLCQKLDKYKEKNIDENDPILEGLLKQFQENHDEIVEIKKQLKELNDMEENSEKNDENRYSNDNMFKEISRIKENTSNTSNENKMVEYHENFFAKIIRKIKKWLKF